MVHADAGLRSVLAAEKAMERSASWTRWTLGPFMGLIGALAILLVGGYVQTVRAISALEHKVDTNDAAVSQQLVALQKAIDRLDSKVSSLGD